MHCITEVDMKSVRENIDDEIPTRQLKKYFPGPVVKTCRYRREFSYTGELRITCKVWNLDHSFGQISKPNMNSAGILYAVAIFVKTILDGTIEKEAN